MTFALFFLCNKSGTGPDDSPEFTDFGLLGNKLYVAYKSPDRSEKPDTINPSFKYNSSKVKSIIVQATLDSAKTWINLGPVTLNTSLKVAMAWIPKNDSVTFNYFGKKQAFIRVLDSISNNHIESDSFFIVGRVPYVLTEPQSKETFTLTDTIKIYYSQNQDLSSNLSVGFFIMTGPTGALPKRSASLPYVNITDKSQPIKLSVSLPIKNFMIPFVPLDFAEKAKNYENPITIFVADYGASSYPVARADSIRITQ